MTPSISPTVLRPEMRSRNVVLPEPDGPSNAVISPGLNMPETSLRSTAVSFLSRKLCTV